MATLYHHHLPDSHKWVERALLTNSGRYSRLIITTSLLQCVETHIPQLTLLKVTDEV